jgi:hypothetical protein
MSAKLLPNQLSNALVRVSVAWGADLTADPDTWSYSDITSDVLQDAGNGVSIRLGRLDEFSIAAPASCSLQLKNTLGAYTPYNPGGSNYPLVQLGTPVRVEVSLDGGSNWSTRFQGEASAWTPGWDAQGKKAYVTLTASGITRRLGMGSKPLRSPLTRSILFTTAATLVAYWPCEDGVDATQATSGLQGGAPLRVNGTVRFGSMDYLTQTDFTVLPGTTFGLQPQPQLKEGGSLSASFGGGSSSSWTVQATIFCNPITDDTQVVLFQWTDDTGRVWQVTSDGITTDSVSLLVNGSVIASEPHIMINEDVRIDAAQDGSNIDWSFKPMLAHAAITGSFAGTLGAVQSFTANPNATTTTGSLSVGQVRVWDSDLAPDFKTSTDATSAWNGYPNELATDRLTRLCDEEGVNLAVTGTSATAMGVQGVDTFLNLLRECEAADLGYLLDGLNAGLSYVTRSNPYNESAQLTVDANSGQVPADPGPQPTHDDQRIRNRVTVTRRNGSTVVAEDTSGTLGTAIIGVADDQRTLNLGSDDQEPNIASWLLHAGTIEGLRYPQVLVDFTRAPSLATSWKDMTPTARVDVTNLGSRLTQHPTADVSLLAEGFTEFIASRQWRAAINCSNFRTFEVFEIENSQWGRIEQGDSTLHTNYSAGATSLQVDVNSGPLWSTSAASFDVAIRGWKIHVTAVSGSSSPQTFTVTAIPGDLGGSNPVTLWESGVLAL